MNITVNYEFFQSGYWYQAWFLLIFYSFQIALSLVREFSQWLCWILNVCALLNTLQNSRVLPLCSSFNLLGVPRLLILPYELGKYACIASTPSLYASSWKLSKALNLGHLLFLISQELLSFIGLMFSIWKPIVSWVLSASFWLVQAGRLI